MDSETPNIAELPGKITSIIPQKRNKKRYSIFVEEEFLLGVSESTLLDSKLVKGDEVTPLLFKKLQRADGRQVVKSYVLKLLSYRDHAQKELWDKARRKDYPQDVINDVLNELEQKGFIDDAGFAQKFVADKYKLNKWGPAKIRSHLLRKGINKQDISKSIKTVFEEVEFKDTLLYLVLKHKKRFLREENPIKRKKKIVDYLLRRGYKSGTVFRHVNELMEALTR